MDAKLSWDKIEYLRKTHPCLLAQAAECNGYTSDKTQVTLHGLNEGLIQALNRALSERRA